MAKSTLPENFKDDVLATSMGGKRRYRLIHNSDGTVSLEDATTYTQVGSNFGASQVNATNAAVNASLATDGNASNVVNSFSQASARSNLSNGERLSVSLGKIMKWFADLKDSAFRSVANNLSTSSSGGSVLDAYQGYLLNNNKVATSNVIDSLSDVVANTQSKKPAGSLALKAAYNELNGKSTQTVTQTINGLSCTFYLTKIGKLVICNIIASGSLSTNDQGANSVIPAAYRPAQSLFITAYNVTGTELSMDHGCTRYAFETTGRVTVTSNHKGVLERKAFGCWFTG